MTVVQTLVIHQNNSYGLAHIVYTLQAQYMFVFDALVESIEPENNWITGPVNVAKEKLVKLAKVNLTTKMSGYETQFKVIFILTKFK